MKFVLPLAIALTVLALVESFGAPPPPPPPPPPPSPPPGDGDYVNPCSFTLCPQGTICVPVSKERAECLSFPRLKRRKRQAECTSNSDCSQQGSFCSAAGICECRPFCITLFAPVCDLDGNQYSNQCVLDQTACLGRTTILSVPCSY